MRRILPALVLLVTTIPASRAADTPASADDISFFEKKVRPLLFQRCQKCHSTRTKNKRGGLLLDSRAALLAGGDTGPAVLPGQPEKSLLIRAVRHEGPLTMPPSGKLPAAEIAVLEEWVKRGAPYPGPITPVGEKAKIDLDAGRRFWSFQPLKLHSPPTVRDAPWPKRRIDQFLLAGMEKHGLSPAHEADRRTLIRRVTIDLVGLPPAPEEVDRFVNDTRPDAYERLVERLLASPRYGERWGRFWLDLVRYCDVAEPWVQNNGLPWLYRDWVVRAFNDDLPYDQFVLKQFAADLLPDASGSDRAALGFLGLSPSYWKELKLDHNVIKGVVAEEWEERIHTVGSTFLGLTVACARCHDHKFDPITTQDYYALAGVFASIRQADVQLLPADQTALVPKIRARLKEIDKEVANFRKERYPSAASAVHIQKILAEAQELRATPFLNAPAVPGVIDSSLHVEPDGPDRTRLVHKPASQDVALQVRGNPASTGPVVPKRFLAVLSKGEPARFSKGSGRLELAQAILGDGKALAARVMVNRMWKHHFGEGLVRTSSDFGRQGERPTHPELLDDLAARFVQGWSMKWLHREIVLSAAYRQSSRTSDKAKVAADPDNRWLARMSRRRLEVEAWRDAVLSVSGVLDLKQGGAPLHLDRADNNRRTLYGVVKRRELNDLLRLNDFPDPTTHSASRIPTTTPLQQLFVLNSPFMRQQSSAFARRLSVHASDGDRIQKAYRLLYGRPPTGAEQRLALAFLQEAGAAKQAAWEQYAQVLLASNEFLYAE
jgi:hypothetical protein